MGLQWNSWYNPLDNVANVWKNGVGSWIGSASSGAESMTSPALAPSGKAGIGSSNPAGYTEAKGLATSSATESRNLNPTGDGGFSTWGTGGGTGIYNGGGSTGPSYNPEDLAYLDSQKSLYQSLLDRVAPELARGLAGIDDQYTLERNKANTSRSRALEGYQTQEEDTKRSKVGALGSVDSNTNNLADSLRRILGLAGASRSSVVGDAGNAIARLASQQRSGVLGDYGTNMRNLVQAKEDSEEDYNNLLGDLGRQRTTQKRQFETGIAQQQQSLQQILDEIAAKRAGLVGGSITDILREGRDRYLGYEDKITGLADKYKNTVVGRDVKADPVSLRDYTVDRQALNADQSMGESQYSPYRQFLKREEDEDKPVSY